MREQELIVYKDFEKEEGTLLFDMAWLMEHYEDDYYNREDLAGLLYDCMHRLLEIAGNHGFHGNLWHCYLSNLLVHSDQGSHYTSKEFTEFCEKLGITQSMSKAGYPYDNAPMERYFNTLKNDLIYQHYYHTEDELYTAIEEFAYVQYNHVRPHSYNNYKTPYEARYPRLTKWQTGPCS